MSGQTDTRIDIRTVVSRDPNVHSGDLVFAGSRVPVDSLTDYLKGGYTLDRFLDGFPTVERWQAEAFLDLSSEAIDNMRADATRLD